MIRLLLPLLLVLLLAPRLYAAPTEITCTAPTMGQRVWSDSTGVNAECSGGPALVGPITVLLHWQPVTGGGFTVRDSVTVPPGGAIVFVSPGPGSGYVVARNARGPGCASATITIAPAVLTDVPVEESSDPVLTCLLFDVRGRRVGAFPGSVWYDRRPFVQLVRYGVVQERLASGIYWLKGTTRDRRTVKRVVAVLR
jgi:hypothetical protein